MKSGDLTPVSFCRRERRAEARFAVASRATASEDNIMMGGGRGDGRWEMGGACYPYTHTSADLGLRLMRIRIAGFLLSVFLELQKLQSYRH
jgi:hypothetical protein